MYNRTILVLAVSLTLAAVIGYTDSGFTADPAAIEISRGDRFTDADLDRRNEALAKVLAGDPHGLVTYSSGCVTVAWIDYDGRDTVVTVYVSTIDGKDALRTKGEVKAGPDFRTVVRTVEAVYARGR